MLFNSLSGSSSFPSTSQQVSPPNFDSIPVMVFETILDLQNLPNNSILVLKDSFGKHIRLNHASSFTKPSNPHSTPNHNIVLERWTVSMTSPIPPSPGPELPTVYRYCIIHFRALYSLCRTLPAWLLFKRLNKPGSPEHDLLKIGCRLSSTTAADEMDRIQRGMTRISFADEIEIGQRLSEAEPLNHLNSFQFPSVQSPYGALHSQVTYRAQVDFYISDRETALSSRFLDEDYFLSPEALSANPHRSTLDHQRSGSSVPNPTKPSTSYAQIQDNDSASAHPINLLSKPSYNSLSSQHHLHRRSISNGIPTDPLRPSSSSSLTAAIRAAAESPAFTPPQSTRYLSSNPTLNPNGNVSYMLILKTVPPLVPISRLTAFLFSC